MAWVLVLVLVLAQARACRTMPYGLPGSDSNGSPSNDSKTQPSPAVDPKAQLRGVTTQQPVAASSYPPSPTMADQLCLAIEALAAESDTVASAAKKQLLDTCPIVLRYAVLPAPGPQGSAFCAAAILTNNQPADVLGWQLSWRFADSRLRIVEVSGATLLPAKVAGGPGTPQTFRMVNDAETDTIPARGGNTSFTFSLNMQGSGASSAALPAQKTAVTGSASPASVAGVSPGKAGSLFPSQLRRMAVNLEAVSLNGLPCLELRDSGGMDSCSATSPPPASSSTPPSNPSQKPQPAPDPPVPPAPSNNPAASPSEEQADGQDALSPGSNTNRDSQDQQRPPQQSCTLNFCCVGQGIPVPSREPALGSDSGLGSSPDQRTSGQGAAPGMPLAQDGWGVPHSASPAPDGLVRVQQALAALAALADSQGLTPDLIALLLRGGGNVSSARSTNAAGTPVGDRNSSALNSNISSGSTRSYNETIGSNTSASPVTADDSGPLNSTRAGAAGVAAGGRTSSPRSSPRTLRSPPAVTASNGPSLDTPEDRPPANSEAQPATLALSASPQPSPSLGPLASGPDADSPMQGQSTPSPTVTPSNGDTRKGGSDRPMPFLAFVVPTVVASALLVLLLVIVAARRIRRDLLLHQRQQHSAAAQAHADGANATTGGNESSESEDVIDVQASIHGQGAEDSGDCSGSQVGMGRDEERGWSRGGVRGPAPLVPAGSWPSLSRAQAFTPPGGEALCIASAAARMSLEMGGQPWRSLQRAAASCAAKGLSSIAQQTALYRCATAPEQKVPVGPAADPLRCRGAVTGDVGSTLMRTQGEPARQAAAPPSAPAAFQEMTLSLANGAGRPASGTAASGAAYVPPVRPRAVEPCPPTAIRPQPARRGAGSLGATGVTAAGPAPDPLQGSWPQGLPLLHGQGQLPRMREGLGSEPRPRAVSVLEPHTLSNSSVAARTFSVASFGAGGARSQASFRPCLSLEFSAADLVLGGKLGSGAFGSVYRAKVGGAIAQAAAARLGPSASLDSGSELMVAVKKVQVMCDGETYDTRSLHALRQEVQVLSQLSHPHIVQFLGAYLSPPHICIVEELAEGGSLHWRLHARDRHGHKLHPPLTLDQVLQLGVDVSSAMCYLHPSIVHRDLKPQNVLMDRAGRAKLCDFGLVKVKDRTMLSTKNVHAGTTAFMAPEQFGGQPINEKVDVYAFSMLLFECITGEQVWADLDHPMQIIFHVGVHCRRPPLPEDCPPALASLICCCWQDDPSARPPFSEVLARLQEMQGQEASGWGGILASAVSGPSSHASGPSQLQRDHQEQSLQNTMSWPRHMPGLAEGEAAAAAMLTPLRRVRST